MRKLFRTLPLLAVTAALTLLAACSQQEAGTRYFAFRATEDGKWGFMDVEGNELYPDEFEAMPTVPINDRFSVMDDDGEGYVLYALEKRPRKIGTFKDLGAFTGELCPAVDDSGNMMLIDKEGRKAVSLKRIDGSKVVQCWNFSCGRAMVKLDNGKWGFIDEQGQCVVPCKYGDGWSFKEGVAVVASSAEYDDPSTKWWVIDVDGNKLFSSRISEMEPVFYSFSNGLLPVRIDGRVCFIDKEGNVVKRTKAEVMTSEVYDNCFVFSDPETAMEGLMDVDGNVLLKARYSSVFFRGGCTLARTDDDKVYVFSRGGEKVGKLPDGYCQFLGEAFNGREAYFIFGDWGEPERLYGPDGQRVPGTERLYEGGCLYYSLAITSGEDEEEY